MLTSGLVVLGWLLRGWLLVLLGLAVALALVELGCRAVDAWRYWQLHRHDGRRRRVP